jgi:hypothetical protein
MSTIVPGLVLAACALLVVPAALTRPAQNADPRPIAEAKGDDDVVLDFGPDGENLMDVLDLFRGLLACPIEYSPVDVAGSRIRIEGPQLIARAKARDALESLLDGQGFWCWDDVSGGATKIIVRRKHAPGDRGATDPGFTPRLVTLEELQAGPTPRLPQYTVSFQLKHLRAVDMLIVIGSSALEPATESVRVVEGSNSLLVKASPAHLLHVRDLLAATDVPAPATVPTDGQLSGKIAALEQRLAALEQRLAALDARLAAVEPAAPK